MTEKQKKYCIFCDNLLQKDNRSKEHVIPQWLLQYLDIKDVKIQTSHFNSKGNTESMRSHSLEGLVVGQVCCDCNNGWMSNLEKESIPILKPLIKGKNVVVDLDERERAIIGRWTAKTAFCLNSSSNFHKNIPDEHFKYIKNNSFTLPKKVSSFGQQHHGREPFYWIQSSSWVLNCESDEIEKYREPIKSSTYKISLQFGKLILMVCYLPFDDIFPVLWKGIHIPLIPKTERCSWYEKTGFNWNNSEKALCDFHFGLQAILIK